MISSPLVAVQITDTHLFADDTQRLFGMSPIESLQAVLQQVEMLQRPPDLLLLTGGLSQDGQLNSYATLKEFVEPLGIPTVWLPGNHDNLTVMQQMLDGSVFSCQKSFLKGGWQFLLLNSQVADGVQGCLSSDSLDWLEHQLRQQSDRPTVIALHHPPFVVESGWLDSSMLQNPADLFAAIDRHPQVKLVLFGHIHQEFSRWFGGVQYFGTPSTCFQLEPYSLDFALDRATPGFRLLYLYSDGTWWTTVERTASIQHEYRSRVLEYGGGVFRR